ncbi:MAG: hypothetical protein R3E89_05390 [Thiolinea sp.]
MPGIFHYQLPGEHDDSCSRPVSRRPAVEVAAHKLPVNDYARFWRTTTAQLRPLVSLILRECCSEPAPAPLASATVSRPEGAHL